MTNAQMWAAIIAFFLPVVLALIQQPAWPRWARAIVTFIVAIIVGVGTLYFAGTLVFTGADAKPIATNILLVLVTAISTYESFWKPTGIAPKIEAATSGPGSTPPSVPGSVVTVHVDDKPVLTIPAANPASSAPPAPPASPAQ